MNWTASLPGIRAARCCKISAWDLKPGRSPRSSAPTAAARPPCCEPPAGCCPSRGGRCSTMASPWASLAARSLPAWWPSLPQTRDIPSIRAGQLVAHGRYPHLSFGRDLTKADREKDRLGHGGHRHRRACGKGAFPALRRGTAAGVPGL